MCGIVGYVGNPENEQLVNDALHVCLEGLRRLEYRGYDSAGVAVISNDVIAYRKRQARLANWKRHSMPHPYQQRLLVLGTRVGQPTVAQPTTTPTRTS